MRSVTIFLRAEEGAITVDWVAITAGILLLGVVVSHAIFNDGVSSLVSKINSSLGTVNTDVALADAPDYSGGGDPVLTLAGGGILPTGASLATVGWVGDPTTHGGTWALAVTDGSGETSYIANTFANGSEVNAWNSFYWPGSTGTPPALTATGPTTITNQTTDQSLDVSNWSYVNPT